MDVRQIVGENIRRYRREKGLSQAEVANRMGVDRAYISGLELGQRNPTVVTLWHAAQALDVEVHLLLKAKDLRAVQDFDVRRSPEQGMPTPLCRAK
jgi:transcriptional regulator with XRE-family HTH domain